MDPKLLPHLETFAKAAELVNFTAAGQAVGVTQAAVSQRIQALEKELGATLFRREGGHLFLTEAGHRLYAYAQQILGLHREARQEITGRKTEPSGELRLAASSVPGEHLLPGLLALFQKQYPGIQVRLNVGDSQAVMSQVDRGEVALGVVGQKSDNPHLEFKFFAKDRLVLVVPVNHPWSRRRKITLTQLAGQALILREIGSGSRHCLEKGLERLGKSLRDMQVIMELGSNEAIKAAVQRGVGAALLSIHAVAKELQSRQLRALTVVDLPCDRDMSLVWDKRRVLPAPARIFRHFLETHPLL
jgi:DNA-binding transcriptional LysR family regulator